MSSNEIVSIEERHSIISSHSIGVPEMTVLLDAIPLGSDPSVYRTAVVDQNLLGFETEGGRAKRMKTLEQLYVFDPASLLFRALTDLWSDDSSGQPLLLGLFALARDSLFRLTADRVMAALPGDEVPWTELVEPVLAVFPDTYVESSQKTIGWMAHKSWTETGHLEVAARRSRVRSRPVAKAADLAFALLLGHLSGLRGDDLFGTVYAKALDLPAAHLPDLAFEASRRGMIEYRSAGGVTDVGFKELLRPFPDEVPS